MRIEDVLTTRRLLDYVKQHPAEPGALEGLFPTINIEDFECDVVMGAYNKPVLAEMYAFDTPTELGQREAYEMGRVGLNLIKEKMKLDEREIMRLERPRSDAEQRTAIARIYRDVQEIQARIENRIEFMRYQVIQTGKIHYQGNGLNLQVDYGIPKNHKGTLEWSDPEHDILGDMVKIKNTIKDDTGFDVTHVVMSNKWLQTIIQNKGLKLAMLGTESERYVTPGELNSALAKWGLFTISVDEKRYATQKVINGKLVKTFNRFLDEDTCLFLPDGSLGNTIRGLTPESLGLNGTGIAQVSRAGDTVITHYAEVDPVAHYVKGSATAAVTFPYADQIYIGKFKKSEQMGITVADVKKLLPSFGYTPSEKDNTVLQLAVDRITVRIKAYTHLTSIPMELEPEMLTMMVGEFLYMKKNLGGLEDGGIKFPSRVSQVTEGDTSISISNVGKVEEDFDNMIDGLRKGDPRILDHWRALHW